MLPVAFAGSLYSGLAVSVLVLHALFILWVVLGAFLVWSRPVLRWLHIASLVWGILTEVLYWPCPLTFAENALEQRGASSRTRAASYFTISIADIFRYLTERPHVCGSDRLCS